ncbi:MAG: flagellar hook-associated protein FlgK [Pseudomonadales bacterium]|nr:flagellar hook-associated protein FlgK [Pseudomonadales bacterium]
MGADLLNIAISGLRAYQAGISTTGHNITNAEVPGYSRQRVELATRGAQFLGGQFFGTGIDAVAIGRIVDDFVNEKLRVDISTFHQMDTYYRNIVQVDNLLAGESTSISLQMQNYFAALQVASDDPTSLTGRQMVLDNANALAERFHDLLSRQVQLEDGVNRELIGTTGDITVLAQGIAEINREIVNNSAAGSGPTPNDLLDRRDQLIRELSENVELSVLPQANGSVNLYVGTGQVLVIGATASGLVVIDGVPDPGKKEVALNINGSIQRMNQESLGSKLGGLVSFRNNIVGTVVNSLGRTAMAIADQVNAQHQLGIDLEGKLGGRFFTDINDSIVSTERVVHDLSNALPTDRVLDVTIADVTQLTTSDYELRFDGPTANDYLLIRLEDNAVVSTGPVAGIPAAVTADGFSINLTSGSFQAGDRFVIKPTYAGAQHIAVEIPRPHELAIAAPIRTTHASNNQGSGSISQGTAVDTTTAAFTTTAGALAPPILIRFNSATSFDVLDNTNPAAPAAMGAAFTNLPLPPTVPGQTLPTSLGYQIEIQGVPVAGDSFTVDYNSNGVSDNRNLAALSALNSKPILENSTITFEGSYQHLIALVGVKTSIADINREASQVIMVQSQNNRESVSGVNLDEEAALLIQYEQMYQASAQVIAVARSLFDTLINAI